MQVNNVSPNFNGKIIIPANKNQHRPYLYNEILDTAKENKITSAIKSKVIELDIPKDYKTAKENVFKTLEEKNIKFEVLA